MNREDIIEDIKIGDIIKIRTDFDCVVGKVEDISDSSLKISRIDTGKVKRIGFEIIVDYDFETNEEETVARETNTETYLTKSNCQTLIDEMIKNLDDEHRDDNLLSLLNDSKRYKKTVSEDKRQQYEKAINKLQYAEKNHEYNLRGDKVKEVVAELNRLAKEDIEYYRWLGRLYYDFREYNKSIDYLKEGMDFAAAFEVALECGRKDDLRDLALFHVVNEKTKWIVIHWISEYTRDNGEFDIIGFIVENNDQYTTESLLIRYRNDAVLKNLPNHDVICTEDNKEFLISVLKKDLGEKKDGIFNQYKVNIKKEISRKDTSEQEINDGSIYGEVVFYNPEKGFGTIVESGGSKEAVFFHIKQVSDIRLQRRLFYGLGKNQKVRYRYGKNIKGKAADNIEIDDRGLQERREGFISDYLKCDSLGRICSNGKEYSFILKSVISPLLRADIEDSNTYDSIDVIFSIGTLNGKKIAVNIEESKPYDDEVIKNWINTNYVTEEEVERWNLIKHIDELDYQAVEYIELPLYVPETEERPQIKIEPNYQKISRSSFNQDEAKAVAMIIPADAINPFSNLISDYSGRNYYFSANKFLTGTRNYRGEMEGVDLKKAEEYYIKSIGIGEQIASCVVHLTNIYIRWGGEYVVKGLQILEEFGYLLPNDKLLNIRIQLIDKSGNEDALALILESAIPRCEKKTQVVQYMNKLSGIYFRKKKWDEALKWSKKCISYLDENKADFPNYTKLRNYCRHSIILTKYSSGEMDEAISLGKIYLKDNPGDIVVSSIVSGSYMPAESTPELTEYADLELQYEDQLMSDDSEQLSSFLTDRLQDVDLGSTFNKLNMVYSKTQDGRFVGNTSDVKKAVDFIQSDILKRGKATLSAEYRSAIYIGIARIIYDSRRNESADNESKLSIDEVKKYIGRYSRYMADAYVERFSTLDSIRFLYIQALKNMAKGDDGNIAAATNMLVATFFADGKALTDELHDMKSHVYNYSYYSKDCISIKDFIIATIMLRDKQEYANDVLNRIYQSNVLRNPAISALAKMSGKNRKGDSYYEFESLWRGARAYYCTITQQITKEVKESINDINMIEGIRQHNARIEELMNSDMLWNQDVSVLNAYRSILSRIESTYEKYTVEEKIEGYRSIEIDIDQLKTEIKNAPTELSYESIYVHLDELKSTIRNQYDELYFSSRPECLINLSSDSVYVNGNLAEIGISFSNEQNKQDADAVSISLTGSEGASFVRCEKQFTSIRSGEVLDYLAVFELDERVINDGQFEVTVDLEYVYRESVEQRATATMSEILPVNISDKENFIKIENKYNRILRGTSVDIKTPELFKGRNELIESICSSMRSDNGVMTKNRGIILWGQRRVGKNSVKDYLKERIRNEFPNSYIIIELGSLGSSRSLREVLMTIINKTKHVLRSDYEDIYGKLADLGMEYNSSALEKTDNYMPEFSKFMDMFSTNLKKLGEDERNIPLYFIDEFSYLYEWIEKGKIDGKEFMRFWKSFISDYGICSIIIAQDNIPVWRARYENEFACMSHDNEISFLDFEGARELICDPCRNGDKELFTTDAARLIYEWTLGSAFLIVIFCKHVIDYLNEHYIEKATKTIVQIAFEREFLERKGLFESADFEPQIQDVANVGEEGERINSLNEILLKEIAKETITSPQVKIQDLHFFEEYPEDIATRVFGRLKDRKIIDVEREAFCSICMPLLKFYLLRKQSLLSREVFARLTR